MLEYIVTCNYSAVIKIYIYVLINKIRSSQNITEYLSMQKLNQLVNSQQQMYEFA